MKKMLTIAAMVTLIAGFSSCKKDNKEPENVLGKSYFSIEKGTYVNGNFPAASQNAPVIGSVAGNSSILEGGSNPVSITTDATVKEVLIGVQGKNGYYKVPASELKATTQTYLVYLLFSQNFEKDNFTILVAIATDAGLISEGQTVSVSRIVAGTGKLQISCSWNKPNDLDLHLVEPKLEEIYWDNDQSVNGGLLDVDSNPTCYIDNINNENITYSANAVVEKGKYTVRICLFKSCEVTDVTNYVVTARLDGNLITPTTGKNPYYGTVTAEEAYIGGSGVREGKTVMEFNIAATKSASFGNIRMIKFSYPKRVNLAKRALEL